MYAFRLKTLWLHFDFQICRRTGLAVACGTWQLFWHWHGEHWRDAVGVGETTVFVLQWRVPSLGTSSPTYGFLPKLFKKKTRAWALQKETQAQSYLHRRVHFWYKVYKEAQVREAERKFSQEHLILNYYIYIWTRNAMAMCFHLILFFIVVLYILLES